MTRKQSKYFWPASAISESDMHLLFLAKEASPDRTSITRLLAHAVRTSFGHLASGEATGEHSERLQEAA